MPQTPANFSIITLDDSAGARRSMSNHNANRNRLIEIVKARSFSTGAEIKLVSGRSSSFYFNMKPTMLDAEGAHLIATLVLDSLKGEDVDLVGGLEMGAVPLASAVAVMSHTKGWPLQAFFVRKQAKEHGARKLIEGLAPNETLQGKRVVILEDVTTTGGSSMKAVEAVKAEGGEIVRVISIVDRLEGAADSFKAAGVPFSGGCCESSRACPHRSCAATRSTRAFGYTATASPRRPRAASTRTAPI
jgi:orotate phosphoribosyltransferase